MNTFSSEICSSGCESGWTLYLENSFLNQNAAASHRGGTEGFYEEEHKDKRFKGEEEDLSMVSDASSGPPHFPDYDEAYFNEEVNGCFYSASNKAVKLAKSGAKKQKVKENQQHLQDQQHLPSFLHDTASSPVFDFSTVSLRLACYFIIFSTILPYMMDCLLACIVFVTLCLFFDKFSEQC
ncbi:hypothetical protein D0Y65_054023 [Glycine soja]|uniref:Uncharacterized protein n=1 Tax=Glycine soja TaxID=3848 RepID=A0A445F4K0_GLYSO|nr:hypothetical protein D0Y65_054023 [Glycine soja]RZB43776.1 hypothetical protein D0Y65_054023 [Glycine soja]